MSEHYCTYKDGMCELDIDNAYQQGRADEQLRSIESAKEQAKEYRVALEKAKTDGAKEFAKFLIDKGIDVVDLSAEFQRREIKNEG